MDDNFVKRAQHFWQARTDRERRLLGFGGAVLTLGLIYGLLYAPLMEARTKLQKRLPVQRAELRLLEIQTEQIERLRRKGGDPGRQASLQGQIESLAAAHDLRPALKQLTALGADQVQISTDPQPIDIWMGWLNELDRNGLQLGNVQLTRTENGQATLIATVTRSGT